MKNFYYCVDVGGTYIKAGVVDEKGKILFKDKCPTNLKTNSLAENIIILLKNIENSSGFELKKALGLGVACPGMIDSTNGIVKFAGNLNLTNYPLEMEMKKFTKVPIKLANDADAATLAELILGSGKGFGSAFMFTFGTGVGGGFALNGHLLPVNYSGEIGHMKLFSNGIKCTCGEEGCYETMASTAALIRQTKEAVKNNPNSLLNTYPLESISGKTIFEFLDKDKTAKEVFDRFITYAGTGIVNIVNTLNPDVIIIGGAISAQKDVVLKPLTKYVNEHVFKRHGNEKVEIKIAKFTNDAGIIGARFLF
ncbi:MAG: ROK family protein [Clostridia bacterium]|nr:ROK family protein [Clostridia bacterium]